MFILSISNVDLQSQKVSDKRWVSPRDQSHRSCSLLGDDHAPRPVLFLCPLLELSCYPKGYAPLPLPFLLVLMIYLLSLVPTDTRTPWASLRSMPSVGKCLHTQITKTQEALPVSHTAEAVGLTLDRASESPGRTCTNGLPRPHCSDSADSGQGSRTCIPSNKFSGDAN